MWDMGNLAESLIEIFNPEGEISLIPHGLTHDGLLFSHSSLVHTFESFKKSKFIKIRI
jgi:hypothetical protein